VPEGVLLVEISIGGSVTHGIVSTAPVTRHPNCYLLPILDVKLRVRPSFPLGESLILTSLVVEPSEGKVASRTPIDHVSIGVKHSDRYEFEFLSSLVLHCLHIVQNEISFADFSFSCMAKQLHKHSSLQLVEPAFAHLKELDALHDLELLVSDKREQTCLLASEIAVLSDLNRFGRHDLPHFSEQSGHQNPILPPFELCNLGVPLPLFKRSLAHFVCPGGAHVPNKLADLLVVFPDCLHSHFEQQKLRLVVKVESFLQILEVLPSLIKRFDPQPDHFVLDILVSPLNHHRLFSFELPCKLFYFLEPSVFEFGVEDLHHLVQSLVLALLNFKLGQLTAPLQNPALESSLVCHAVLHDFANRVGHALGVEAAGRAGQLRVGSVDLLREGLPQMHLLCDVRCYDWRDFWHKVALFRCWRLLGFLLSGLRLRAGS